MESATGKKSSFEEKNLKIKENQGEREPIFCANSAETRTLMATADQQPQCSYSSSTMNQDELAISHNTKLFLNGEWINIPSILISDESILRAVLNKESFNSLSQNAKNHLKRFLPESRGNNFEDLLNSSFTDNKKFCFGTPLGKFYAKIRDGFFSGVDNVQLRDHKRVLYDHYIRHYQMNLLKKLLVNRHAILEQVSKLQPIEPIKMSPKVHCSQRKLAKYKIMKSRAKIRAKRMIDDCRVQAGESPGGISSDESAPEDDSAILQVPPNARSTMFMEKYSVDLDLYQPIQMKEVSELYREYSYLRETEPDCPSLDITDITLEEVYERTGISFQTERNFSKITEQNLAQFMAKKVSKLKEKGIGGSASTGKELKNVVSIGSQQLEIPQIYDKN